MKKIKIFLVVVFTILFVNIFSFVNADELPDGMAMVSSSQIIQLKTGTGPFDENDEPGNDSSEDNMIVRSFDQVTWTIENTMGLIGDSSESYSGGKLYFEAKLPDVFNSETIKWNLDSMAWIEDAKLSSDKLTLSGYYSLNSDTITIPGKQSLVFIVDVLGAANGTKLKPTFTFWLNGNNDSEKIVVDSDEITVSATPKYNIKLIRNANCESRTNVNIDGESITGRMYGYAVVYQLYNENISKGLKGIEYPQGDITLDLNMKLTKRASNGGEEVDITNESTPILWNYQLAAAGKNKGVIPGRNMFGDNSFTYNGDNCFPAGKAGNRLYSVFDSGKIDIEQNGSILNFTLSDYKFDGKFPIYNAFKTDETYPIIYTSNIGCFASIYLQILVPDWDEFDTTTDYYLRLNDENLEATSISGETVTNQIIENDDSNSVQYVKLKPGSYTSLVYLNDYNTNGNLASRWDRGDSRLQRGQKFRLNSDINQGINNDEESYMRAVNVLQKFDGDAYGITLFSEGRKFAPSNNKMTWNMWYVTKKDGTNWQSQQEMNDARVNDVILYENYEDIPEDYLCVGAYYESNPGGVLPDRDYSLYLPLYVKDTAVIGQTYGFTQAVTYWTYALDRDIYTATNPDVEWPTDWVYNPVRNYIKTEYDSSGTQISGTHAGGSYYGNTAQIIGAIQSLSIKAIEKENEQLKVNYDMSKNEYDVTYMVSPAVKSTYIEKGNQPFSVDITVDLPVGITYVPGSSSDGEPEVTINANGSSTLKWTIQNCIINETISPIKFYAHIYENTSNGTQYDVSAVMLGDSTAIGTQREVDRTATCSIQIINLASHRLYKSVSTPVIEKNGEIHYTLSYKNNTDDEIPDFQLLDILPYNGDNRGTDYTGTYKVKRIVIKILDANDEIVPNDKLIIKYTDDESVRTSVTCKDENLGDDWTELNTENLEKNIIAFVVKGTIAAQEDVDIDVYLETNGNKGLDKYVNSATTQVYVTTEEMTTSNVVSQVVERKIEGIAWEDLNANGIKDNEEKIFKNVEIKLTDDKGQQVTDVDGNIVSSVRTDENGYYKFENLPKGNYYIKVSIPEEKYILTEKNVGLNNKINSKFNIEAKETDKITKLNSIELPELIVSNVNAGFVKKPTKVIVNYKEVGKEGTLLDEETIDGRIDDVYETQNKITQINEKYDNKYKYVRIDGNVQGEMTEDTIYVTYWYEKKDSKVKVLHVVEGTDVTNPETVTDVLYKIEEKVGKVDDPYTTQNRLEEINQNSKVQYELVTDEVENKNGNIEVDTKYVIYEYRTIPAKVKVNHIEKDTNKVLYAQEVLDGLVGNDYKTSNKLTQINNDFGNKYELVTPEPTNKNGVYTKEEQEVTYYYQKKMAEIEVNYLEVGTNSILSNKVTKNDRIDSDYVTENKLNEINEANGNKYSFVRVDGNVQGKYTLDKQVITYWYEKKPASVVVKYIDIDSKEEIYEEDLIEGKVDDRYTTVNELENINKNKDNKYEFVSATENTEGEMTESQIEVIYYYQKKPTSVNVKYIDIDSKEEIYEEALIEGKIDDEYETVNELENINKNKDNKYEFVSATENTEGQMTESQIEVVYYYQKKASNVKVLHVLEGTDVTNPETVTDVLYSTEEIKGKVDDAYTTSNKLLEINKSSKIQYDLVTDEVENKNGNLTLDTIYVIYEYRKAPATIKVEHKDINTDEDLVDVETRGGIVGEDYTTSNKLEEINGENNNKYELVSEPENKDGEFKREEQTITYYYQKKGANVVVKYIDIETEEELVDSEEIIGRIDDEYETEDKIEEINEEKTNKYILVKTTENTEGKMTEEPIEVIYYYKKVEAQVVVKYVDEKTGEEISEKEYLGGYVGDEYTTKPKDIDGYKLVENRLPENKDGVYEEDTLEVVYYYNKIPDLPETGDIAVIGLICLAVLCSAGVIFVIIKTKNKKD